MDAILTNPCGRTGEIVKENLERHGVESLMLTGPSARKVEQGYLRLLHKAAGEFNPKMIIPIFYPEILAAHKAEFPGILIPVDSPEKILSLDDKISACGIVSGLGMDQPAIYHDIEEIKDYPVVFKRPLGQGGDSVYFPKTRTALEHLLKTADKVLITSFIEGENISIDAIRWGNFFYAAAYRVLLPTWKGVSTLRESIDAPELVEKARLILDSVDYQGVCGIDFRIGASDGKAYFLECNPRFSGGLESAIASGFEIPWIYWRLASGENVSPSEIRFTPGIRTGSASA